MNELCGLKHPLHFFARSHSAFVAAALDPDRAVLSMYGLLMSVGDGDHDDDAAWKQARSRSMD